MTKALHKTLLLFITLSITSPMFAEINTYSDLINLARNNDKVAYDCENEKLTIFVDTSYLTVLTAGLLSFGLTTASLTCILGALLQANNSNESIFLAIIGGIFAIPGFYLGKKFNEHLGYKIENIPHVIIDNEGIACSYWSSFKKLSWDSIKTIYKTTVKNEYGFVVSEKLTLKLKNKNKYVIYGKLLPININTLWSLIEYCW